MNLLTATSARASAIGAAAAVRVTGMRAAATVHFSRQGEEKVVSANETAIGGFSCKRGKDSWNNMGSCGSAEDLG